MSLARADALRLPLRDGSVDLVVTSPPYFGLRSYTDDGGHYPGQIGSEPTPHEFLEALWAATAEMVRVLKPSGSIWVNLGDKYARNGGSGNGRGSSDGAMGRSDRPLGTSTAAGFPEKSLMGLPWRYAIGCIDRLGLILRAEVIWSKPNGLPESVTDRVRRSHEQWFHFTREPRYFSAVDEIREPTPDIGWKAKTPAAGPLVGGHGTSGHDGNGMRTTAVYNNPLGKLPGSVRTVPTEPLIVPDHLPQHFAAFPSEWPRWIIQGWSPKGVCVECGEGRTPEVESTPVPRDGFGHRKPDAAHGVPGMKPSWRGQEVTAFKAAHPDRITGYSCACPTPDAPTTPAVVLDPFAGTGTTVAVANALGRHGIGVDLSADYLRLARWRCQDPKLRAKVLGEKFKGLTPEQEEDIGMLSMFGA